MASRVRQFDFSKFTKGSEEEQAELCSNLVDAVCQDGFVTLRNHGIDEDTVDKVFQWNKRFFDLPLEAKNKAAHAKQPNPHRGYSYVGQEKLSKITGFVNGERNEREIHDIKESFDQGPHDDIMYPNRWTDEEDLPGFRAFMESFFVACHEVYLRILQALAKGLGLEDDYFQRFSSDNASELRLLHYPACQASLIRDGAMRISEHTDFGMVTLLFQDSVGGLEMEDHRQSGNYFPLLTSDKHEMIVNIGDCLQRWTNDKFRSTSHRVTLPPVSTEWLDDRYSVAYFGKPNRQQGVGTLPEFLPDGGPSKYENISAWEYNQQKLLRTY